MSIAPIPSVLPASYRDAYKGEKFYTDMTSEEQNAFDQAQYGQSRGMGAASLEDFKTLLGRLESSKIRQQQAKDVSARPNIYAQGLAQMMSNF